MNLIIPIIALVFAKINYMVLNIIVAAINLAQKKLIFYLILVIYA